MANLPHEAIEQIDRVFYPAIWAADRMGVRGLELLHALVGGRQMFARFADLDIAGDGIAQQQAYFEKLADMKRWLLKMCGEALRNERDKQRATWQKQQDYLIDCARRVHFALEANSLDGMHYFNPAKEEFVIEELGYGHYLYLGMRTELKAAITYAMGMEAPEQFDKKPFAWLVNALRRVIEAAEWGDESKLRFYQKSPLHLSKEQVTNRLWEGCKYEIGMIVAMIQERKVAA